MMRFSLSSIARRIRTTARGLRGYLFERHREQKILSWRLFYMLRIKVLMQLRSPFRPSSSPYARIWIDTHAFHRIEQLLKRARHSVIIQMFIWADDETGRRIASLLVECADRGVTVHVTKEAVGDVFEGATDFLSTKHADRDVWRAFWHHPNIQVTHAAHNDHGKVFVIDDDTLLLSSLNIADIYRNSWHDYTVELRGRTFVEQYLSRGETPSAFPGMRVVVSAKDRSTMRTEIMTLLARAERSIVVEHTYLSDPEVIDALVAASRRDIDVLVILPAQSDVHQHANMQSVATLLTEGDPRHMRVLLYPRMVHGKLILVDRRRAFLGSANLIPSSLDTTGEVNVLLDGRPRPALRFLRKTLLKDALRSSSPPYARRFPLLRRILAWLQL